MALSMSPCSSCLWRCLCHPAGVAHGVVYVTLPELLMGSSCATRYTGGTRQSTVIATKAAMIAHASSWRKSGAGRAFGAGVCPRAPVASEPPWLYGSPQPAHLSYPRGAFEVGCGRWAEVLGAAPEDVVDEGVAPREHAPREGERDAAKLEKVRPLGAASTGPQTKRGVGSCQRRVERVSAPRCESAGIRRSKATPSDRVS